MIRIIAIAAVAAFVPLAALADSCPGNPGALGTERVLEVDAKTTPRVGRKQFPSTLPLARKEVVLTFDDGPWPETTHKVLEALAHECVRATFFMLGKNAEAHPDLARHVLADGHTVAYHTYGHPLLDRMPLAKAEAEINHGIEEVEYAVYGQRRIEPVTPFFRFPGFEANKALLDRMAARNIVVFGADVWASDWNPMSPDQELRLIVGRVEASRGGIVLFHDTKAQTAKMLPAFLRELKKRGFKVVHVVAKGARGVLN